MGAAPWLLKSSGSMGPQFPVANPGGSQPNGSWDPVCGHYDVNDGSGNCGRYLPDGTAVDHFNNPISNPMPVIIVGGGLLGGALIIKLLEGIGVVLAF